MGLRSHLVAFLPSCAVGDSNLARLSVSFSPWFCAADKHSTCSPFLCVCVCSSVGTIFTVTPHTQMAAPGGPTAPSGGVNLAIDFVFKLIVIGPTGVGKSSLILQFMDKRFDPKMDFTIGVEFGAKLMQVADKRIKLQLWDTAGQESFRSTTNSYYRGAQAAFLVYDVTRKSSFASLPSWLEEIRQCADPNIVVLLVGNKTDLQREVSTEEGQSFAEANNLLFIEASAKTASNVEEAFGISCRTVLEKVDKGIITPQQRTGARLVTTPV